MSFAAVAMMVSAASAQSLLDVNFEDGTRGSFTPWGKNEAMVEILGAEDAKDSQHALRIKTGIGASVKGFKKDVKYRISLDKKFVGGKGVGVVQVGCYNPDVEGNFQMLVNEEMSQVKEYEHVSFEFTTPRPFAAHRVTIAPSSAGKGGGNYIIDNVKIEVVK